MSMDTSNPVVRRMMMNSNLQGYVGKSYVVRFLTSERGLEVNDKECVVTGHNGERLEVRMKHDGSLCRVKPRNLLPVEAFFTAQYGPPVPDDDLVQRLRTECASEYVQNVAGRPDVEARVAFAQRALAQGQVPPPSKCMDPMIPESELTGTAGFLQTVRPCCYGDGTVVFSRFNAGLVGHGAPCAVCLEDVESGSPALGFPCGHIFHSHCAGTWLAKENTCPSCRLKLGMPGHEYQHMFDYEARLDIRLREWFISGMCERCQAAYQETDPLCVVSSPDGGTPTLVPRSKLPVNSIISCGV